MDNNLDACKTIRRAFWASSIALVAVAVALIVVSIVPSGEAEMPLKAAKRYAISLVNNELYEQAVEQYEKILADYRLSEHDAGSMLYQIGDISAEHLHNPRKALAAYLKLKQLYPDHPLVEDVDRKIIAQLDRLGQSRQAQRMLEKTVSLGKQASEVEPSQMVAKIGDRAISAEEIEKALETLPPELASQLSNPQGKSQFLRSYVGQQLIYDAALREGYDTKPEVQSQLENAQKNIIISAYYQENVAKSIDVSASDVEIYYELHKDRFGGAPLDEVRGQVREAAMQEKIATAQMELIDELLKAENVQLFPENLNTD